MKVLLKFVLFAVGVILINPKNVWAGSQKITELAVTEISARRFGPPEWVTPSQLDPLELLVTVQESGKLPSALVTRNILFVGKVTETFGCEAYVCMASLRRAQVDSKGEATKATLLMAVVEKDGNQDGNYEARERIIVGTIEDSGRVHLFPNIEVKAQLVEERYTWLEKLAGAEDKDFHSLQIISR